jgi:type II secretory pathway pseudopilin PulG
MKASRGAAAGFTYVGVLLAVALIGMLLAGAGQAWRTQAQREREAELLFVGDQYRAAIDSYVRASPGAPEYPQRIEDLLEDRRLPSVRRHLRRPYRDPMTGSMQWDLLLAGQRIQGVASRSGEVPLRRSFPSRYREFEDAASYRDWRFVSTGRPDAGPGRGAEAQGAAPAVAGPGLAGPVSPPAPEPGVEVVVPPAERPDADARCDAQRVDDLRRCVEVGADATSAAIAACTASAAARHAACRRRQNIPPLALPGKR